MQSGEFGLQVRLLQTFPFNYLHNPEFDCDAGGTHFLGQPARPWQKRPFLLVVIPFGSRGRSVGSNTAFILDSLLLSVSRDLTTIFLSFQRHHWTLPPATRFTFVASCFRNTVLVQCTFAYRSPRDAALPAGNMSQVRHRAGQVCS